MLRNTRGSTPQEETEDLNLQQEMVCGSTDVWKLERTAGNVVCYCGSLNLPQEMKWISMMC